MKNLELSPSFTAPRPANAESAAADVGVIALPVPQDERVPDPKEKKARSAAQAEVERANQAAITRALGALRAFAATLHSSMTAEQDVAIRKRLGEFELETRRWGGRTDVPEVQRLRERLLPDPEGAAKAAAAVKRLAKAVSLDVLTENSRMVLGVAVSRVAHHPELRADPEAMEALAVVEAHSPISPDQAHTSLAAELLRRAAEAETSLPDEDARLAIGTLLLQLEKFAPALLQTPEARRLKHLAPLP